jgi:hypothetical protein
MGHCETFGLFRISVRCLDDASFLTLFVEADVRLRDGYRDRYCTYTEVEDRVGCRLVLRRIATR